MGKERPIAPGDQSKPARQVKRLVTGSGGVRRACKAGSAALLAVILSGCATGMTDRGDLVVSAPAVALPEEFGGVSEQRLAASIGESLRAS